MNEKRRIVLGEEDFAEPKKKTRVEITPDAATPPRPALPPVQGAGQRPTSVMGSAPAGYSVGKKPAGAALNSPQIAAIVAAAIGMFLAWAFTEVTDIVNLPEHATSKTSLDAYVGIWAGVLELIFVGVLVSFDRAVAGAWAEAGRRVLRAAIPAAILGFLAGFAAQAVYTEMINPFFTDPSSGKAYFARALGWAIFGAGAGLTFGVVDRAAKKCVYGLIGGGVGGFLGGLVFQFVSLHVDSARPSRLLGLLAIGIGASLATYAVETALRDAWLRVVAGGMSGKEFILYHAVTRIGSSPDCEIFLLKDPDVAPLHARIEQGARRTLVASAPIEVNGRPVTSHELRSGDQIQIGHTVLSYSERR